MGADLTPRERVRAALWAAWCIGDPFAAIRGPESERESEHLDNLTGAALTALADHPGLVEALRGHTFMPSNPSPFLGRCRCQPFASPTAVSVGGHQAHQADVIRAWLRGAS